MMRMAQSKMIIPLAVVVIVAVAIVGTYYAVSPAAPVTPGVTTLSVDTTPVKGEVSVDGVSWGTAPVSREVDPGTYTVTFGAVTDYTTPASQSVTVASGETKSITATYVAVGPEKLKVAFMLPGSLTDASWNASMYTDAHEVADELNLDIEVVEQIGEADIDPYLVDFAARGFKIIFAHSFNHMYAVERIAPDYPDTWFFYTADVISGPNVGAYMPSEYQSGYLAGILAAGITKTNKIGHITGFYVPDVLAQLNNFKLGAWSVNPDIEVLDAMAGAWDDITKGREMAESQIAAGADVILAHGDGNVLGIIQAGSLYPDVYVIGYIADQNIVSPDTVISSCVVDWKIYIRDIVERYRAGTLENTVYSYGLAEGATYLAPYHELDDIVPQDTKDMINEVIEDVNAGTFSITVDGTVYNELPFITEEISHL